MWPTQKVFQFNKSDLQIDRRLVLNDDYNTDRPINQSYDN